MPQDTQVHIYTDPDGNSSTAPSSIPVATGAVASGAAAVGAAVAGAVDSGVLLLLPPSLVSSPIAFAAPDVRTMIPGEYILAVIGFGLLSVGLQVYNLLWGLSRKRKWAAMMRAQQADLDTLCKQAKVL